MIGKEVKALLDELSSALADVVEAMKAGQDSSGEVAAALADMVQLLEKREPGTDIAALAASVRAMRIQASDVTVNVSPTPVTVTPVVQILERVQPGAYEMRFTYDRYDRLETAVLVPLDEVPVQEKAMMFGGRS